MISKHTVLSAQIINITTKLISVFFLSGFGIVKESNNAVYDCSKTCRHRAAAAHFRRLSEPQQDQAQDSCVIVNTKGLALLLRDLQWQNHDGSGKDGDCDPDWGFGECGCVG